MTIERFKLFIGGNDTEGYITDKIEHKTYFLRSDDVKKEITEILNQFYNENEDLKTDISVLNRHYDEYEKICTKLKRENEQLKSKYSEQCIQNDFLKNQHIRDLVKEIKQLKEENYKLKQGIIDYSQYLTDKSAKLEEENNELKKENEQLKSVIGRLKRTIEEYEEQKENDSTISRNDFNNSENDDEKNCGLCKHYNLDGMFGVWCDIHEIPTHDKYCSDFERNRR